MVQEVEWGVMAYSKVIDNEVQGPVCRNRQGEGQCRGEEDSQMSTLQQ